MANEPDSGDIKITVSFLKEFQSGVLKPIVDELNTDPNIAELRETKSSAAGKRRLWAGNEALFEPARVLIERYESATGTAPTLYTQVESMQKYLDTLHANISQVVRLAETGEDENIKLTTELNVQQLGAILGAGPTTPPAGPTPPPAPGPTAS